jgi:hypothetical protein
VVCKDCGDPLGTRARSSEVGSTSDVNRPLKPRHDGFNLKPSGFIEAGMVEVSDEGDAALIRGAVENLEDAVCLFMYQNVVILSNDGDWRLTMLIVCRQGCLYVDRAALWFHVV